MIIIFLPPAVDAKHIPPTGLIYTGFVRITCYIDEGRLGQFRFKLGNRFCSRKNKIKVSKMKWRAWPSYISRMCLTKAFIKKPNRQAILLLHFWKIWKFRFPSGLRGWFQQFCSDYAGILSCEWWAKSQLYRWLLQKDADQFARMWPEFNIDHVIWFLPSIDRKHKFQIKQEQIAICGSVLKWQGSTRNSSTGTKGLAWDIL